MLNEKTFKAPNISCGHCEAAIKRELGALSGVDSVTVDIASKSVTVKWNEPPATWDAIKSTLVEINYPPA